MIFRFFNRRSHPATRKVYWTVVRIYFRFSISIRNEASLLIFFRRDFVYKIHLTTLGASIYDIVLDFR